MSLSTFWVALALVGPVGFVVGAVVWNVLVLRRRHGGGLPLPPWLITAERASPGLRELVARMARSSAKDAIEEMDHLPPGLKAAVRREVQRAYAAAYKEHEQREETST